MKEILNNLYNHHTLSYHEAKEVLTKIGRGEYKPLQVASFLTVYNLRSITSTELAGFRDAMLDLSLQVDFSEFDTIDIVGTGGDGKNTFNISTTAAFIVAGAGHKITKHGNYGVSSVSGSSNVLEYLGVSFTDKESILKKHLEKSGFCILHAPLFHPAMKYVAPIRKELQVRTFFNILGPLINPGTPKYRLLGVYSLDLARLYAHLYQDESINFQIVHSLDKYDEVSLTSAVKVISNSGEQLLQPNEFGFLKNRQEDLSGGATVKESAKIMVNILKGEATPAQTNAALANAALAIQTIRKNVKLEDAVNIARESIHSGKAYQSLKNLIN